MTEEEELQAKIDALSGKIEQAKQRFQRPNHPHKHFQPVAARGSPRWSPYRQAARARFPNRTLAVANHTNRTRPGPGSVTQPANQGKQSLKKEQEPARELVIEGIRFFVKSDGSKLIRASGIHSRASVHARHQLTGLNDSHPETPKKATVAGITFLRTRQGNLSRVSNTQTEPSRYLNERLLARSKSAHLHPITYRTPKRVQCDHFTRHGTLSPLLPHLYRSRHWSRYDTIPYKRLPVSACGVFTDDSTGTCPFGPSCRFAHDPKKIAICKDFLRFGSCIRGNHCDMSHDPTYHRAPACAHFLRGNCTNSACRYPHVKVSLSAPVCRAFASTGYCSRGLSCDKRHVTECPDYANHGHCANRENGQCKLPHTDHASTLRKAEQRRAKMAAGGSESDLSSDDEQQSDGEPILDDDDDSDAIELLMGSDNENHELSQQQDFVSLS